MFVLIFILLIKHYHCFTYNMYSVYVLSWSEKGKTIITKYNFTSFNCKVNLFPKLNCFFFFFPHWRKCKSLLDHVKCSRNVQKWKWGSLTASTVINRLLLITHWDIKYGSGNSSLLSWKAADVCRAAVCVKLATGQLFGPSTPESTAHPADVSHPVCCQLRIRAEFACACIWE